MAAPITAGDDPLWYKDAVIYQLHVKSFFDANNDGIGDFPGLISKLDYIADLGATTIWLLPFYPSPRRDDGYDIALYEGVSPDYGTMEDARRFIEAAHARGIRVITELVVNHTSDQHPWFQAARNAPKGSPERNYYVWADDDQGYQGTRIIFLDTEKSNWTYDPVAGQYFWHRFYSHQPDLNFDNPEVLERILSVMRFWLDMGVDGLRLDAVPYLIEREGTSNENLSETHDILKKIRAHLEERYTGRMLLAEANMWPEDTQQYFGENGDECHMAFHFPLMPRMYMAIAKEDRFPITDILRQTPAIPDNCQWAIFLRNHDELTLEMVTDAERDYLWTVYAADQRARLNLGIRRRLAPLLQRDRRRIELMNALLLSMPGTPVIYYGDEIGMGDNIHLGDRDGVRTPMQWSPDRNGGFSKADPEQLVLPPIQDPLYGYYALNVEAQLRDPHSLLNWTRRVLAIRKRHPSMGRGTFRLLYPGNRRILAYLRCYEDETILCVANLSQTLQAVELDLSEFDQRVPVEMGGGTPFPPVGRLPYLLTVPPYGFYAFNLSSQMAEPSWHSPPPEQLPEFETLVLRGGLADVVSERHRPALEREALPAYVRRRRWFASRNEQVKGVRLSWAMPLPRAGNNVFLAEIAVDTQSGTERYVMPLAIAWEDLQPSALSVQLALTRVRQGRRVGYLTDALTLDSMPHAVVRALRSGVALPLPDGGDLRFVSTSRLADVEIPHDAPIHRIGAEEASSTIVIEECATFKVIRRTLFGTHPESEMVRYLTEQNYANTAPLLGEVVRFDPAGHPAVMAVLLGYVRNQGDAWNWTIDQLRRALTASGQGGADIEHTFEEQLSGLAPFMRAVGRRLAEFHTVLARPTDNAAFSPEVAGKERVADWTGAVVEGLERAFAVLEADRQWSSEDARLEAQCILAVRADLIAAVARMAAAGDGAMLTRIHGDFHFGQVMVAGGDAYIVNFDGHPHTATEDRRRKDSPWRDVAGLVRSIDAAAAQVDFSGNEIHGLASTRQRRMLMEQFKNRSLRAFLSGYVEGGASTTAPDRPLMDLFLLELIAGQISAEAEARPVALEYAVRSLHALAVKHAGAQDVQTELELEEAPA
ncbi:maltose alpha-D-glucosyltransferase [Aquabacter sp. CN5-332]|uniref:maltose alpha-D-glucosyltransferase n=1 Tax=Aquabacter sp. CN5-332 TaxID=3156608 RepID=UPI0032B3DB9C